MKAFDETMTSFPDECEALHITKCISKIYNILMKLIVKWGFFYP